MIVIRAGISAGVDIPPNYAATVEEAEQKLTDLVRQALASVGNVRTAVEVKLQLSDVEQLRDDDVPGYLEGRYPIDYDGRYE